jgi:hypothetical protein
MLLKNSKQGGRYFLLPCLGLSLRIQQLLRLPFPMFGCEAFHSEYPPPEVKRHTPLTDKWNTLFSNARRRR